jgi:hypothetical protein
MPAIQAGERASDLANCVIEALRMRAHLTRRGVEDWGDGTTQPLAPWVPKIDGERSLVATEE